LAIVGFAAAVVEESEMTQLLERLDHHQNLLLKLQADLATVNAENAALRSVVGSDTRGLQIASASQPGSSDLAPSHRRKLTTASSTGSILYSAGQFVIDGGDITSTSRFLGAAGSLINMAFAQSGNPGFGGENTDNGNVEISSSASWDQGGQVISYSPIYSDSSTTVIVQCGMSFVVGGSGTDKLLFKLHVYDSDTSATSTGWEQVAYFAESSGGGGRGMPNNFVTEFSGWTGDTIYAQILGYNGMSDDAAWVQNTQCTFIEKVA